MEKPMEEDHINKLPDDILVRIISLHPYKDAVQTASVSRRWERLVAQLPKLKFSMSLLGYRTSRGTPSEQRVQSMERTLRRRCRDGSHAVEMLRLVYRKDVPMECRHADDFIALANPRKLLLHIQCARGLPDEDAGAWSLDLPPATTELHVLPYWYAVRPPRIHGPSVDALRSLTLSGLTVLPPDFLLTVFSSLEDLHIGECTLAASISVTSDTMPRLKHLEITDVCVMTNDTKAAISVVADELKTLRVSCHRYSSTKPPSEFEMFRLHSPYNVSFTTYSCFRLRAPRLRAFEWRCSYADEVRVESVGQLSDVTVELAAGRMPREYHEELRYVTTEQRDNLMRDILLGLMPGLQPRRWENVMRKCVQRDDRWLCFEITNGNPVITE